MTRAVQPPAATGSSRAPDALDVLYAQQAASALRVAILLCGDRDLAEGIVGDAFVTVASNRRGMRDPDAFAAALIQQVVALTRARFRRRPVSGDALHDAVQRLPLRERETLVARYYLGYSDEQTADVLDCPTDTVKLLRTRGLTHLEAALRTSIADGGAAGADGAGGGIAPADLASALRGYFAAEVEDVPDRLRLPEPVRDRTRRRRARRRGRIAACVLVVLGVVIVYAVPKIRSTAPDGAAPMPEPVVPTTVTPARIRVPATVGTIPPVGAPTGTVLAIRDGHLVTIDPATGAQSGTVSIQGVNPDDRVSSAQWSPDGASIFLSFRNACTGSSYGINEIPAAGGRAEVVTTGNDALPTVSPDGSRLAVLRTTTGCVAQTLVVRNLATGNETARSITTGALDALAWSGNDRIVLGATVGNGEARVLQVSADGTETLDLAPALVDGSLLGARTLDASVHVIVAVGHRIVDVDPVAFVVRGTLGTPDGVPAAAAIAPSATRLALVLRSGAPSTGAIWASTGAGAVLPRGAQPVDWSVATEHGP